MPHPIYGPPTHDLERVELRLWLPSKRNGHHTRLTASGWSETSRSALWTVSESWERGELDRMLQPCDAAHHILLTAAQDRCETQGALERSLTGEGWTQPELW